MSAIHGSKECILYICNFNLINANEKDQHGNIPLFYLIKNHNEDNRRNREMFLWLASISNLKQSTNESNTLLELFTPWQNKVYNKYIKDTFIKAVTMTEV